MVVITCKMNKRPITEKIVTKYYMLGKGEIGKFGRTWPEDHITYDFESVVRFPAGATLFRVVETSGSSAVKTVRYFEHVGDLMKFLARRISKPSSHYIPFQKSLELGLVLTELMEGKYKKVIYNRNVTWEVRE